MIGRAALGRGGVSCAQRSKHVGNHTLVARASREPAMKITVETIVADYALGDGRTVLVDRAAEAEVAPFPADAPRVGQGARVHGHGVGAEAALRFRPASEPPRTRTTPQSLPSRAPWRRTADAIYLR